MKSTMKKCTTQTTAKKLHLAKETLRHLDAQHLVRVAGGVLNSAQCGGVTNTCITQYNCKQGY